MTRYPYNFSFRRTFTHSAFGCSIYYNSISYGSQIPDFLLHIFVYSQERFLMRPNDIHSVCSSLQFHAFSKKC